MTPFLTTQKAVGLCGPYSSKPTAVLLVMTYSLSAANAEQASIPAQTLHRQVADADHDCVLCHIT